MTITLVLFRWPQLCLAFWVGLGLASSGCALQALFANPLADPYVIGVSGSAALFGSLAMILFGFDNPLYVALFAVAGSLVVCIAFASITSSESMLLAGLLVNAFASALISLVKILLPADKTQSLLFWLLGSIPKVPLFTFWLTGAGILSGTFMLVRKSRVIELLSLGDDEAMRLGVNPAWEKRRIHFAISLIVGVIVAFCGFIGFVGLLVPQIARMLIGNNQQKLIPISALSGGVLLLLFESTSMNVGIPTGVLTALVGTPVFGILAYATHRKSIRSY
ncbi:MAG: iron ABC transporter permease [Myxococcota bacterium]